MARLTWDSVSVPNFGNAVDGIATANQMLNQGFNAARNGIREVEEGKTARLSNQAMMDMLQYQDPEQLKTALANNEIQSKYNSRYLNSDARNAISGRVGDLLAQQLKTNEVARDGMGLEQDNIKHADYMYANSQQGREIINALNGFRNDNNMEGEKALRAMNPEFFRRVNPDVINAVIRSGQGISATDFEAMKSRYAFNNEQDAQRARDGANRILIDAGTLGQGERYVNENSEALRAKYGDAAVDMALVHFRGGDMNSISGRGVGGAVAAGAGGGAGGATPAYNASKANSLYTGRVNTRAIQSVATDENRAALLEVAGELGLDPRDLATVISYETAGKFDPGIVGGKGNNHRGLIQFGESERKEFGYRDGMTFAEQMRGPVKAYLAKRGKKGMDLLDLYSTINAGSPGRYNKSDNGGKDTVRSHAARMQREHGGNALAFLGMTQNDAVPTGNAGPAGGNGAPVPPIPNAPDMRAAIEIGAAIGQSQTAAYGLIKQLATEDLKNTSSVRELAQWYTTKGTFKGEDLNHMMDAIVSIQKKYGIESPAVAARILSYSAEGTKTYGDKFKSNLGLGFMPNMKSRIDEGKVKTLAEKFADRASITNTWRAISGSERAVAAVDTADKQVNAVMAQYLKAQQAAADTGRAVDHKYWQKQLDQARAGQWSAYQDGRTAAQMSQDQPNDTTRVGSNKTPAPPPPRKAAPPPARSSAGSNFNRVARPVTPPQPSMLLKSSATRRPLTDEEIWLQAMGRAKR